MLDCSELRHKLSEIITLKEEFEAVYGLFDSAMLKDEKRKLLDKAGDIKDSMEEEINSLEKELFPLVISAEYEHLDGWKEVISINFEEKLRQYKNFYAEHMIPLPIDFDIKMKDIWEDNREQIEQGIKELGFDDVLFIPADLNLDNLHQQMTEDYFKTYRDAILRSVSRGSFSVLKELNVDDRIIIIHSDSARNLKDHEVLKNTLGKSLPEIMDISFEEIERRIAVNESLPIEFGIIGNDDSSVSIKGELLSLSDYFIFQRRYFDLIGEHPDAASRTWLSSSTSDHFLIHASFNTVDNQLSIAANINYVDFDTGTRICRKFYKKS